MRMIFVNLPVHDVAASRRFYQGLGFSVHEQYSDDHRTAVILDESIVAMLHVRERFAELVVGDVGDPAEVTTVVHTLTVGSREEVDDMVATALATGGRPWQPSRGDDVRYRGSFGDPDGNVWEAVWMGQHHVVD